MDEQQTQSQTNTEDTSTLLPTMPKFSIRKGPMIILGVILLVAILAGLHFSMTPDTPIETTRETSNGNIVTITPPAGAPTMVPEIVTDKDGKEYITGELIVTFNPAISVEDAKKAIVDAGGTIKQHFAEYPGFLVGISEKGAEGVNRAMLTFQTVPGVTSAEPNYLTEAPVN